MFFHFESGWQIWSLILRTIKEELYLCVSIHLRISIYLYVETGWKWLGYKLRCGGVGFQLSKAMLYGSLSRFLVRAPARLQATLGYLVGRWLEYPLYAQVWESEKENERLGFCKLWSMWDCVSWNQRYFTCIVILSLVICPAFGIADIMGFMISFGKGSKKKKPS